MIGSLDNIVNSIETQKEILSTLPVNTKKNKGVYLERVKKCRDEYKYIEKQILKEIKKVYEEELGENMDDDGLTDKLNKMNKFEGILTAIDKVKTPYEKMKLDRPIYNLRRFYRKNLQTINQEIRNCIDLFSKVGINLTTNDFKFTPYVNQYMNKIFECIEKDRVDTSVINEEFEEIYWKCPNIIIHIQLNFRYIYLKKESSIARYYNQKESIVKSKLDESLAEINKKYNYLKRAYIEGMKKKRRNVIDKFMTGVWTIKDYEEKAINRSYTKFINIDDLEDNSEEIHSNLIKLLHNLYEYKNYMKFKYLFDDVKRIYVDEKNKNSHKIIKKSIMKKGGKLDLMGKFMRYSDKEQILKEMEELFEQLDDAIVKNKIHEHLNEKSNLNEIGTLILSFYKYLFNAIIKHNKNITEPEIKAQIEEFEEFIKYPYNIISESVVMMQDKDIPMMIRDRYNLFDIKITTDAITESNIDNLLFDLERIENNYYIKKSGLQLEYIEELCKIKSIAMEFK